MKKGPVFGTDVDEEMIERLLKRVKPDYVKYDGKGHGLHSGGKFPKSLEKRGCFENQDMDICRTTIW